MLDTSVFIYPQNYYECVSLVKEISERIALAFSVEQDRVFALQIRPDDRDRNRHTIMTFT